MKTLVTLIALLALAKLSNGVLNSFTVSEPGSDGATFTFKRSMPDLSDYTSAFQTTTTICFTGGRYVRFAQPNYTEVLHPGFDALDYNNCCFTTKIPMNLTMSIRLIGAPDTTTSSVSVYSEKYGGGLMKNTTRDYLTTIPFAVQSFSTSGNSTWTFYEKADPDEEGKSCCFISKFNVHMSSDLEKTLGFPTIGFVKLGCVPDATRIFVADEEQDWDNFGDGEDVNLRECEKFLE